MALARDALCRVRWDEADRELALDARFQGVMRDRLTVTIHHRDGASEAFPIVGDEARWLESLPRTEQTAQLRHRIAASRGLPKASLQVVAVESLRRRKWPADLGWEPQAGRSRATCVAEPDLSPAALAFCGSPQAVADGLAGLVESGLAAACRVVGHFGSVEVRA